MTAKTHNQSTTVNRREPRWPLTVWMSRAFMGPPTLILLLISFKFFKDPAHTIAAKGVALTEPEAMTDARVIGAISMVLAILILWAIFSKTRLRLGHSIVVLVMGLVLAVRFYGFMTDGTTLATGDQAQKTIAEFIFLILNSIGLVVQTIRSRPTKIFAISEPVSA